MINTWNIMTKVSNRCSEDNIGSNSTDQFYCFIFSVMEYREITVDIPKSYSQNQQQQMVLPLKSTIWACAEMNHKTIAITDNLSFAPKVGASHFPTIVYKFSYTKKQNYVQLQDNINIISISN